MFYFVILLACSLLIVMTVSAHNQRKARRDEDLYGIIPLMLPVNTERMRELFDPAEEWTLRSKNSRKTFTIIQHNRRKLALQYALHMYRNAGILQRLGRAAMRMNKESHLAVGRLLVDAGVAVRMHSFFLLFFLHLQQLLYAGSNLSAAKTLATDLLPEYSDMLSVASRVSQILGPGLYQNLVSTL